MTEQLLRLYCELSRAYRIQRGSGDLTVFIKRPIYNAISEYSQSIFNTHFGVDGIPWQSPDGLINFRISDHVQGVILTSELNSFLGD